jgi:hypothetical protein
MADGQLSNSVASIYTVGSPYSTAFVKNIVLFNNSATPQTVTVYILRSGSTKRGYRQFQMAQYESVDVVQGGQSIELSVGDAIQAVTTTASEVDYTVWGVQAD